MGRYASWGNYPVARQDVRPVYWRDQPLPVPEEGRSMLPYGLGRSYGDSCLNDGGVLIDATGLNRFIECDRERGVLRCEAGVSLAQIGEVLGPLGWFLPVTPGTKFVTMGGALANDVHGKNHHRAGTFGRHVTRFELLRSDGTRRVCSSTENADLFRATLGGLGLTGLITWAEIRMKQVETEFIEMESIRFDDLGEFFDLAAASDAEYEHTMAWIDCLAAGSSLGRGIFMRGNHAPRRGRPLPVVRRRRALGVPFNAPGLLLNNLSIRAFNTVYYHRQRAKIVRATTHYDPFFYPLDSIDNWNRLYGRRGFMQYQCVVRPPGEREAIREILTRIASSGQGSFLAVLKVFGDVPSAGLMSFPCAGVTLALDFPNRGRSTLDLLEQLDGVVRDNGGRVYPGKDARMSAESFQAYYPGWRDFSRHIDPGFSSSFWRRVTGDER